MAYIDEFGCEYSDDKKEFLRCPTNYKGHYTIQEGVTSIGYRAFSDCIGLTSVTIPNSVTSIGYRAFSGCSGLTKTNYTGDIAGWCGINFGVYNSNPTEYSHNLYIHDVEVKDLVIPDGVTSIGDKAFEACRGLTSVTIPNSVTSIGDLAFYDCIGLTSVTIPNSVTSIGSAAFVNVPNIVYSGTATDSPWGAYSVNGYVEGYLVYESEAKTQLLACSSAATGEITIPNSVTSIRDRAFNDCRGLTSVTIPNSVTSIGWRAFRSCSGLTSVTIPNSVTSIGDDAFFGCSGLTSVTIPNSVMNIGRAAFDNVPNIVYSGTATGSPWGARSVNGYVEGYLVYESEAKTQLLACSSAATGEITIPNSVTSIGEEAFRGCRGLTSVTIPNSVTSIGRYAFKYCRSLTSVTIPNSVTSIGDWAFSGCRGLTSVVWHAKNCADFSSSNSAPFYDIASQITSFTFGSEVKHIPAYLCYGMKNLTSVTIPNSVTSIGENAFSSCRGLTSMVWNAKNCVEFSYSKYEPFYDIASQITSFTFGSEVKHIPAYLCYGMENLTSVTIPNSVTSIGDRAFSGCRGLTSVTIPNSVTSIGDRAFSGCSGLTSVTIPNSVTSIGEHAFCGCSSLTSVTIPNSVTSIGSYAFRDCRSLTSVTIPNSVMSIGEEAFYDCIGLTSVTIPNSVTNIGREAFDGTAWLANQPDGVIYINQLLYTYKGEMPANTSVVVRDGTTQICGFAFSGCSGLTSVTIPNSVTSIGSSAFFGCSGLTSVTIPNSVMNIGRAAFVNVPNIVYSGTATGSPWGAYSVNGYVEGYLVYESEAKTQLLACSSAATGEITIPNSVTSIGDGAFWNRSGLTSVTIPNNVTSIGEYAFCGCSGLTSVTIPNSVTSIGEYAFEACDALQTIFVPAGQKERFAAMGLPTAKIQA